MRVVRAGEDICDYTKKPCAGPRCPHYVVGYCFLHENIESILEDLKELEEEGKKMR